MLHILDLPFQTVVAVFHQSHFALPELLIDALLVRAAQPNESTSGNTRGKAQRFVFIFRLMRSTNVRLILRRMMNLKRSGRFHFHVLDHLIDQPVFQPFLG